MIQRLKHQQEKLLISERHEAWSSVARKLAHEIKNPLTPIQLIIDNLRSKYLNNIEGENKEKYESNLNIINNQIKQIENLVNEFSDFARMPKPLMKENNLNNIINNNIKLLNKLNNKIQIKFKTNKNKDMFFLCDLEQMNRVIFNLIKNSIDSISEKYLKNTDFKGLINIEIFKRNEYIGIIIFDNGTGFKNKKKEELIKPYFTTKNNGSGLGLSIVNKIITDHNGVIKFSNYNDGAKIQINFNLN